MKALVYTGPETLEMRDAPDPTAGAGEVLVAIDSVGICGSDMHAYLGHDDRRPAPLILGHEAAGTIVGGARDGVRVTINPLVTNPTSAESRAGRENLDPSRQIISMPPREGAFAQYVTMPERNLVEVPHGVSFSQAALAEPLAVSWHAVRLGLEALHPSMERRAVVLGGGAIGVAAYLALQGMGVKDVILIEPNPTRRDYLTNQLSMDARTETNEMAPLIVDAVGYSVTRATASALAAPGGVIVHIGLGEDAGGLDIRRMTLQEITFIGTYTYTNQDFRDCAQAMWDGRLGPLNWIEERPLRDGARAFAQIKAGEVLPPKIILKP
ncbi:MAG: alcohol dehydrogenase catalytic domain-containing protein [Rhodobacteraceae bacterium]|nr:alcohol dehydrogenase catalytic domain-containing protein [Paracoccaceae bacterium]